MGGFFPRGFYPDTMSFTVASEASVKTSAICGQITWLSASKICTLVMLCVIMCLMAFCGNHVVFNNVFNVFFCAIYVVFKRYLIMCLMAFCGIYVVFYNMFTFFFVVFMLRKLSLTLL